MLTGVVLLVSFFGASASPAGLQHGGTALDMHEALPDQALRFSEQRSKTGTPANAVRIIDYGKAVIGGVERFKCWDSNIVTNQNGRFPQVANGGPANCYTKDATRNMDATKGELSTAWCRGNTAGPLYNGATTYTNYWAANHHAMKQFFQFDRFGIRFKLEPYGHHDVNHRHPSPTACRSGDEDTNWHLSGANLVPGTHAHDIANTYVATFEDGVTGAAFPFNSGKILRHGVMGFAKQHEWDEVPVAPAGGGVGWPAAGTAPLPIYVQTQSEAMINHFGFRNTVSMNLMTGGSMYGNEKRFIGLQDAVLQGASTSIAAFKAATLNYPVNFFGRVGFGNGADTNYPQWKIMTVMVLDELRYQMSTAMLSQPRSSMQAILANPPDECTRNYNGALGRAFNALSWNLAAGVDVGDEIARLQGDILVPAIDDHERRAITCVLKQAEMLFSQALAMAGGAGANGKAPGHNHAEQRDNAKRAIKVLLKSVYAGGSGANDRAADIMRMGAFSAFLGTDSMVNCKSGLDRTGLVAPIFQAFAMMVYSMERNHQLPAIANTLPHACKDTLLYIAENWEDIQGYSNSYFTSNYKKEVFAYLNTGNQRNGQQPSLCVATAGRSSEQVMQSGGAKLISQFRSTILELVIKTSLPITYLSTGAIGVKWGGSPSKLGPIAEQFLPTEILQGGNRIALTCPDTYTDNCKRRGS